MKKNIMGAVVVAMATLFCNGAWGGQSLSTISGTWERRGGETEVSLYYIISGRLERLAGYRLQDDKKFAFAFAPSSEGYYVIGTGNPGSRTNKYTFYFKPGDHLSLAVNDSTYVLVGENTPENKAMTAWHDHIFPLERNSFYPPYPQTYVDYFPALEERAKPYNAESTGNKAFEESFAKFRKFDLMSCALNFIKTPRSVHPQPDDFPDYYKTIKIAELTANTDILKHYSSLQIIDAAAYLEKVRMNDLMDIIKNDTIKGEMFLRSLMGVRDFTVFDELKAQYEQYIITEDQQKRLVENTKRIAEAHNAAGAGRPAINFTYKDQNGKEVSLSDFKGKVVYVDVWATWCGPCRAEIPFLKEVEKQFHGNKDIVFISVSTDAVKDHQKWKNFIEKEQLTGIQLFSKSGMDITELYQINGIPRFLLFDKRGNVVSTNAPRPSSRELVPLLSKLLN